jgi:(4S)-4-hydroxy-5-phosphonooxypentane-2,3-dione isomerase
MTLPSLRARRAEAIQGYHQDKQNLKGQIPMRKSMFVGTAAIALAVAAWMLLPLRGEQATAQGSPYLVNAINLDIAPDQFDKFMAVAKENAVASAKDPGCREFSIVVSQDDPHHIMFFEVYDNAAGLDFHRQTEHFKKFQEVTKDMVTKRDVKRFFSVSMNIHAGLT